MSDNRGAVENVSILYNDDFMTMTMMMIKLTKPSDNNGHIRGALVHITCSSYVPPPVDRFVAEQSSKGTWGL